MKSRVIPSGVDNHNLVDIFSGRLPSSLVIGFVLNSAFRGNWHENGYNFQNFGLTEINLLVNAKQASWLKKHYSWFGNFNLNINSQYPAIPYQPTFGTTLNNSKIMREYHGLLMNIGVTELDGKSHFTQDCRWITRNILKSKFTVAAPLVDLARFHDGYVHSLNSVHDSTV